MEPNIVAAYRHATHRLFLLDYDGTLVDLKPTPPEARPTAELLNLLTKLAQDPRNTVVIISGRQHQQLEAWLSTVPVHLVAEHGLLHKAPSPSEWKLSQAVDTSWKPAVRSLMERYTTELTGASIEEKTNGLAWHFRNVTDPEYADSRAKTLQVKLEALAAATGLRVVPGSKVIEVQPQGVDKGKAAHYWLTKQTWDFMLCAGDDTTDEDMFEVMPDSAFTIKVRTDRSAARTHMPTPAKLLAVLKALVQPG